MAPTTVTAFHFPHNIEQKWDVLQGDVPLLRVRERAIGELNGVTAHASDVPDCQAYFEFPAKSQHVRAVRRAAGNIAKKIGFDAVACEAVMLAVGEAANNAVRYSTPRVEDESVACVRVWILPSHDIDTPGLHVTLVNPGTFTPKTAPCSDMPAAESLIEGGRGFPLMSLLMDSVTVSQWRGQTIVRLWKALPLAA